MMASLKLLANPLLETQTCDLTIYGFMVMKIVMAGTIKLR